MSNYSEIDGLVDYFLETKPYHTKLLEVLVRYLYSESTSVTVRDRLIQRIFEQIPGYHVDRFCADGFGISPFGSDGFYPGINIDLSDLDGLPPTACSLGFGIRPYGAGMTDPGVGEILSTIDLTDLNGVGGIFVTPGDVTDIFVHGAKFRVKIVLVDLSPEMILPIVTHRNYGWQYFTNSEYGGLIIAGQFFVVNGDQSDCGIFEVGKQFLVTGNAYSEYFTFLALDYSVISDQTIIFVEESTATFPPYINLDDDSEYVIVNKPRPVGTERVYEVASSSYWEARQRSRVDPESGAILTDGGIAVTTVIFTEPFDLPADVVELTIDQTLVFEARYYPIVVDSVISYHDAIDGDLLPSNGVYHPRTNGEPDENQFLSIGANSFVVDGNFTKTFKIGRIFEVVSGKNQGRYNTLYSQFVSGKTRIRPRQDIVDPSSSGAISLPTLGYSETDFLCGAPTDSEIIVEVRDKMVIYGMELNFYEDIVVFDLENSDVYAYDISAFSILSLTEPTITVSPSQPVGEDDLHLWFDQTDNVLRQLRFGKYVAVQTATWIQTAGVIHDKLFRLAVTKSPLTFEWIEDFLPGIETVRPSDNIHNAVVYQFNKLPYVITHDVSRVNRTRIKFSSSNISIRFESAVISLDGVDTAHGSTPITLSNIAIDSVTFTGSEIWLGIGELFPQSYNFTTIHYEYLSTPYSHAVVVDEFISVVLEGGNFADRFDPDKKRKLTLFGENGSGDSVMIEDIVPISAYFYNTMPRFKTILWMGNVVPMDYDISKLSYSLITPIDMQLDFNIADMVSTQVVDFSNLNNIPRSGSTSATVTDELFFRWGSDTIPDISQWYQFIVISAPAAPTDHFVVFGQDVNLTVMPGSEVVFLNAPDIGVMIVQSVVQDTITTATITMTQPIVDQIAPGFVLEPRFHSGMVLIFREDIVAGVTEDTSGVISNGFEDVPFDIGPFN